MRVVGIDPGSLRTGFAVVEVLGSKVKYVTSGTIVLNDTDALSKRLVHLAQDFDAILQKYKPTILAIESLFFAKNAQSALKLGHARGVLLMKAAVGELEIFEYTPAEVKSSIVGSGRAQKDQLAKMIKILLKLPKDFEFSTADQSDALAISLAHVQSNKIKGLAKNDCSAYWQTSL
jgi:crossover junction endodeoxyribonuclease RuvC